jgi:4-amino-4-deoxy-L-arabinose transferase-like glycosyltransferase
MQLYYSMLTVTMLHYLSYTVIIPIALLGFMLRFHNYGEYPLMGETKDEYAWSWAGSSLLRGNPPTSWSWYTHYPNRYTDEFLGETFPIVSPWFDHPPLFTLIPGLAMVLRGLPEISLPPITVIRFPMVIIGSLNVVLLYFLTKAWYTQKTAIAASLIYATVPMFVLSSRMVLAENLLITWLLLSLWLFRRNIENLKNSTAIMLGIISGLAVLTKMTGIIVFISILYGLIIYKHYRQIIPYGASFILVVALLFLYGYGYGWSYFAQSFFSQGSLTIGWSSLLNLFIHPNLVSQFWFDGWYYLGLIFIMLFLFLDTSRIHAKQQLLALVPLFWLALYVATVRDQTWHGWYRYPLFPFMSIAIARYCLAISSNTFRALPVLFLGVLPSLKLLAILMLFQPSLWLSRLVIAGLFAAASVELLPLHAGRIRKYLPYAIILLIVIINSLTIMFLSEPRLSEYDQYMLHPI